jgi:hypothetical protein
MRLYFLAKDELKNSSATFDFRLSSNHCTISFPIKIVLRITINTVCVIENGTRFSRIPRFEFLPPKKLEVKSEKEAAEATSKMLARIPNDNEADHILLPFGVNKESTD